MHARSAASVPIQASSKVLAVSTPCLAPGSSGLPRSPGVFKGVLVLGLASSAFPLAHSFWSLVSGHLGLRIGLRRSASWLRVWGLGLPGSPGMRR
jgi:hypothetical protein